MNKDGRPITDNVKYTLVRDSLTDSDISYQNREIEVEFFNLPEQPVYALIQGKDSEGNGLIPDCLWLFGDIFFKISGRTKDKPL